MNNKTKNFIEKAKKVHGEKYDYSKVEYVNNHTKICIICPEHGEFWQTPGNHLSGQNCPKCVHRSVKKTTKEFIEESKEVHGDKYDYSKVEYVNNSKPVCIICPEHGEFWQSPYDHISGCGCKKCYFEKRKGPNKTTQSFISELKAIYGDKYDYSKVDYISSKKKVCLICPEHGEFWVTPNHLLERKSGCPKCSKKLAAQRHTNTTEEFIEKAKKIHGDYYDYSLVNYTGAKDEVKIICPKHGEFWQKPNYHLSGNGCPKCKMSKLEFSILTALNKEGIKYEFHYHPDFLKGLEIDFYFPEICTGIECQGRQHYQAINFFGGIDGFNKTVERDTLKKKLCKENRVNLLYYTEENVMDASTFTDKEKIIEEIKKLHYERNLFERG